MKRQYTVSVRVTSTSLNADVNCFGGPPLSVSPYMQQSQIAIKQVMTSETWHTVTVAAHVMCAHQQTAGPDRSGLSFTGDHLALQ